MALTPPHHTGHPNQGDSSGDDERDAPRSSRGGSDERSSTRQTASRRRVPLGEISRVPTGRVSALTESRAGSGRYVVSIDGRVSAVISVRLIAELGVRVGVVVDHAFAERLHLEARRLVVYDKAIDLLSVRGRSERELRIRLRRAGASEEVISDVVERLRTEQLLDDETFARNVARSRIERGGVSRRLIEQELQRRGVSRAVATSALADTLSELDLDEDDAAMLVASKRLRALRSYDGPTRRRRLFAFLSRRGYPPDVIARVVGRLLRGGEDDQQALEDEETIE